METKSSFSTSQSAVRWHEPPKEKSRDTATPPPTAPSRHSLGIFASARAWMAARFRGLASRQVRTGPTAGPESSPSPSSPSSPWSRLLQRVSRMRGSSHTASPTASSTPSPTSSRAHSPTLSPTVSPVRSTSSAIEPSTPQAGGVKRHEARVKGAAAQAQDRATIGAAMAEGLNLTLAECNAALEGRSAEAADLPAQALKDWHRRWDLSFRSPAGVRHDLRAEEDGSARLINRTTGETQSLDLRPGQDPTAIVQLAKALGTTPLRMLRLASVMSQTEMARVETVIGGQSSLSHSFGEGVRVTPTGGESIRIQVQLGADDEDDRIDLALMREGNLFTALAIADPEKGFDLIAMDPAESFIHWQVEARIDANGRATVDPSDVRFDYTLVESA